MPYDKYADRNGVKWTVITVPNGYTMIASVHDEEPRKYDPPPSDITASLPLNPSALEVNNKTIIQPDPPTGEQTRMIWLDLVTQIEAYAGAHKGAVMQTVTPGISWGVVAGILGGLWLLSESKPRRRRRRW